MSQKSEVRLLNLYRHMEKRFRTDFLVATSSFLTGLGSILNLPGNYYSYNTCSTPEEADRKALECDWGMVGQDLYAGISKFESELKVKQS